MVEEGVFNGPLSSKWTGFPHFFIVCDKRTCVVFQSMGYNCGHLQYLAVTLQHAIEQHRPIVVSWSMALPFSL